MTKGVEDGMGCDKCKEFKLLYGTLCISHMAGFLDRPAPVESPEMEQLRERVRQAVEKLQVNFSKSCSCHDCKAVYRAIALLRPDHIEGKGK